MAEQIRAKCPSFEVLGVDRDNLQKALSIALKRTYGSAPVLNMFPPDGGYESKTKNRPDAWIAFVLFDYYWNSLSTEVKNEIYDKYTQVGPPSIDCVWNYRNLHNASRSGLVNILPYGALGNSNSTTAHAGLTNVALAAQLDIRRLNKLAMLEVAAISAKKATSDFNETFMQTLWTMPFILRAVIRSKRAAAEFMGDCTDVFQDISKAKTLDEKLWVAWEFLKAQNYIDQLIAEHAEDDKKFLMNIASAMVTDNLQLRIDDLERRRNETLSRMLQLESEIIQLNGDLKRLDLECLGAYSQNGKDEEKITELVDFLNRMSHTVKIVEHENSPNGDFRVHFRIETLLEDIDTVALERVANNPGSYWGQYCNGSSLGKFMVSVLLPHKDWKMRVFSEWAWSYNYKMESSLNVLMTPLWHGDLACNYHLGNFQCIGSYRSVLNQYCRSNDVIGALYTAIKATKNFNVLDSTVSGSWIQRVLRNIGLNKSEALCFYNKKTGEVASAYELYVMYKNGELS